MGGAEITVIAPLRQLYERTRRVEKAVAVCMAKTKPTTLVGAAALLDYVRHYIEIGPNWHTARACDNGSRASHHVIAGCVMNQRILDACD